MTTSTARLVEIPLNTNTTEITNDCYLQDTNPEKVWSWDLKEITAQVAIEHPELSEYLNNIENQYRYFIYLSAITTSALKPPKAVDEYWHVHILNTQDYVYFCNNIAGQYIHHHRKIVTFSKERTERRYNELAALSIKHFGKQVFDFESLDEENQEYYTESEGRIESAVLGIVENSSHKNVIESNGERSITDNIVVSPNLFVKNQFKKSVLEVSSIKPEEC